MAKSNYCERYTHNLCDRYGHAAGCDCQCHQQTETVVDEADVAQRIEQPVSTGMVAGSSPAVSATPSDADAEVLRFAESLKRGRQKVAPSAPPEGSLDAIAQRFLDVLYGIDPTWEERDRACAAEWALSPAQRLLKYVGIVLDQQLHLNMLQGYEFLEPSAAPRAAQPDQLVSPMRAECPQCHQEFDRKVPGQVTCSNECGELHFPKPNRKQPEFADDFNEFIESQLNKKMPESDTVRNLAIPAPGVLR